MSKLLILFAHGSKDPKWEKPFELLFEKLKTKLGNERVALAYLERSEPSLIEVINNAHKAEIKDIVILPLFMAGGAHLEKDLPVLLNKTGKQFPGMNFKLLAPIGENPKVAQTIYEVAAGSL